MPKKGYKVPPEVRQKISAGLTGRPVSQETREKLRRANTGHVPSHEDRAKMSAARMGNPRVRGRNHGLWKGKKVGYRALHDWVIRERGPAREQVCAHADDTCSAILEWANISHDYLRDLDDFMPLCASHHYRYDSKGSGSD